MKPALCTHCNHKVLTNRKSHTQTHVLASRGRQAVQWVSRASELWLHLSQTSGCETYLSFVADVSDCNAGQLEEKNTPIILRNKNKNSTLTLQLKCAVLTMPTHVRVIQGLESSFLYTCSFPLVSPTTSSFSCRQGGNGRRTY